MVNIKEFASAMLGAAKSKMRRAMVESDVRRRMLRKFPESVVGMGNMSKQYNMLKSMQKSGNVASMAGYVKEQHKKVYGN